MERSRTNSQDDALVGDFTRARRTATAIVIEAMVIEWPHPSEPSGTWVEAARIPASSDDSEIGRARKAVLRNRRYFRRCTECGERQVKGHMWSADTCMNCAESEYGVVF